MENVSGHTTMSMALDDFQRHCRYERNLDEKTLSAYTCDILQFATTLPDRLNTLVTDVKREDVQRWMSALADYKFRTTKRKLASVNAIMNYLEWMFEDFDNPVRRVRIKLKEPQRLPVVMTRSETKQILECFDRSTLSENGSSQSRNLAVRNRAVIELLFGTGMRIGEL